jgi:hypothetical protein
MIYRDYIESYKVLEIRQGNETNTGKFLVQMEVMIRPTIRDEYVLYSARANQKIDGDFLASSISTYEDQRKSGDKLLMSVLKSTESASIRFVVKIFVLIVV